MEREYYVYILQDSTKKLVGKDKNNLLFTPFYVGKGVGNRSEVHLHNAIKNNFSHNHKLLKEILDIKKHGGKIIVTRLYTSKNELDVYKKEKDTILTYGLRHKGGILVNAGTGIAGGWGAEMNPTFARMTNGVHNFQVNNPQVNHPRFTNLKEMLSKVDPSGVDIQNEKWVETTGYASVKALKIGLLRLIHRDKLPYVLTGNMLKRK